MQLKDILQKTTQFLRDKGSPSARLDTELLIATALKWERLKLYLNYEYPLTEEELTACRDSVRRRASGEPVAYILGYRDFYNHAFKVNSAVLIPRPETETLVEEGIKFANEQEFALRLVDLGTGSGCVGLSVLKEIEEAELLAVDISAEAVAVATENAEALEIADRAKFLVQDAGTLDLDAVKAALGGAADLILANPPYIDHADPLVEKNVRAFEPQQALFSPENGLKHIREWAQVAARIGREGAMVMFEIGHEQGPASIQIFNEVGRFQDVQIMKDLSGRERFVKAFVISRQSSSTVLA